MPIKSYLVYPIPGKQADVKATLSAMPECQCILSENYDLLVLVTDTADKAAEENLNTRLKEISSIQYLVLTSAYEDDLIENGVMNVKS